MSTQYPQVAYKEGGTLYTFVNTEDHDLQVGDDVEIRSRQGHPMIRTVVALADEAPAGITPSPCWKV